MLFLLSSGLKNHMRPTINTICRLLVGLLFIFSGSIKLNDPKGFGYKLNEYFDVFSADLETKQDTFFYTIKEGADVLGEYATPLYRTEKVRKIELNTSSNGLVEMEDGDSMENVTLFGVTGGSPFVQEEYYFADSSEQRSVSISVRIGSKPVLNTDKRFGAFKKLEFSTEVDLKNYIKKDNFLVGFFHWMKDYAVELSMIICILEIVLGIAILIGWKFRLVTWLLLLLIVFFTFLTGYSAYYNKVTDCGCFGDFIKLTPWESFTKDIVLLVLIVILFINQKTMKPLFSAPFALKVVLFFLVSSTALAIYFNMYLPMIDFLPYKKGNDICELMKVPAGQRASDSTITYFKYKKGASVKEFAANALPKSADGWEYVPDSRRDSVLIKAYKPPVHDFSVTDPESGEDFTRKLLDDPGYKLVLVHMLIEKGHNSVQPEINALAKAWTEGEKKAFYALTASQLNDVKEYRQKNNVQYPYYSTDGTTLKTMIRSNPGMILMKGCKVVKKWPARSIPSLEKVKSYMK